MARKCRHCRCEIPSAKHSTELPNKSGFCSIDHMAEYGLIKARFSQEKKRKAEIKKKKESLKTRGDYAKEAQVEFNRFIRLRDSGDNCISCQKPPKKKNAGHYRSVGSSPELRFEPLNCHLQCEHCNTYLSSNAIEYRINLVKKIGQSKVDWLEGPHEPKRYTFDELLEIKKKYKALANDLSKNLQAS